MKSKMLVINGHPDAQSYCASLAKAYTEGVQENSKAQVRNIDLSSISFDLNLQYGYGKRMELENELLEAQEMIRWADHLIFVYPIWWGSTPAVLKGFIDRVFLPGFAFKYRQHSPLWDKLLLGKSAHLIVTSDTPAWYNRLVYHRAGLNVMKRNVLHFCGIKPVRITEIGPIRPSTSDQRDKWISHVRELGAKLS
ncbi:NAD(P)H-dependent oxidoreductase [Caldalkalibacillus mannanilyticus]|uniref:NAD(P)H-dependent oxidoreductase n=1 Tax=Caldalkalibacillus mannanilyticus TaxID=1418 RepID=UPI00046907BC|nr:NAD(P)H-dependent oxidoreductase [Caldalkalibacillus mannanilyticus]